MKIKYFNFHIYFIFSHIWNISCFNIWNISCFIYFTYMKYSIFSYIYIYIWKREKQEMSIQKVTILLLITNTKSYSWLFLKVLFLDASARSENRTKVQICGSTPCQTLKMGPNFKLSGDWMPLKFENLIMYMNFYILGFNMKINVILYLNYRSD